MFNDTAYNPAAIAAETEIRAKRKQIVKVATDIAMASVAKKDKQIDGEASVRKTSRKATPAVNSIAEGHATSDTHGNIANCNTIHDEAVGALQPGVAMPRRETTPEELAIIDEIERINRRRNQYIKTKVRTINGGKALLRMAIGAARFTGEQTKEEKEAARKATDKAWAEAIKPESQYHVIVAPILESLVPLETAQEACEKLLVKLVKQLPVYEWVKSVNGFGDVSFATIVGECGDIGSYRNPSCIWKRMGLAPFEGRAGATWKAKGGLTADQWTEFGYSPRRRSVSFNLDKIIGGMGLWRPVMGGDLADANYYQRVFAERARLEAVKLEMPVTESDKGKESYTKYVATRAMRYTQKRLLRELWKAWRDA